MITVLTITAHLAALQFHSQCTLVFTKHCSHLTQSCLLKFQVIRQSELLNQTIICKMLPDSFGGYLESKRAETAMFYVCVHFQEGDASVHAVLGGPEPDVDTIAATLCLALHLSQVIWSLFVSCMCFTCPCLCFLLNNTFRFRSCHLLYFSKDLSLLSSAYKVSLCCKCFLFSKCILSNLQRRSSICFLNIYSFLSFEMISQSFIGLCIPGLYPY